jgi:hypothetical protein
MPGSAADESVRDDQPVQRFDSVGCELVVGTAVRAVFSVSMYRPDPRAHALFVGNG